MEPDRPRQRRGEKAAEHSNSAVKKPPHPDKPFHKEQESLFSSGSGFQNYRGLLNDCILLLVLSNARSILGNLHKYGLLVNPVQWVVFMLQPDHFPSFALMLASWVFPPMALYIERALAKKVISPRMHLVASVGNLVAVLLVPVIIILIINVGPVGSFLALFWYAIVWMKLVSYVQVNRWCRASAEKGEKESDPDDKEKNLVRYPDNLNLTDVLYFGFSPTLCYELNFPRNKRIRKVFLIRRVIEGVFILHVLLAIFQQWLIPTALSSKTAIQDMDLTGIAERVLILALPNHLFWLLGFYWFFHTMSNLTGEVLRFADRNFYGDWWNSQDIARFWRTWNIPVHRWASRHVYNPLIQLGVPKVVAQLAVFAVSACFHEYLVSIPLHMLRPWAFMGMLVQLPLGVLTALPWFRGQVGNVIVWTSIVLGQPLAILCYMHDYYWINWAPHNATLAS